MTRSFSFIIAASFTFASFISAIALIAVFWTVMQTLIDDYLQEKIREKKEDEVVGLSFISLTIIVLRENYSI
jgi:hypothetical protein